MAGGSSGGGGSGQKILINDDRERTRFRLPNPDEPRPRKQYVGVASCLPQRPQLSCSASRLHFRDGVARELLSVCTLNH